MPVGRLFPGRKTQLRIFLQKRQNTAIKNIDNTVTIINIILFIFESEAKDIGADVGLMLFLDCVVVRDVAG